MLSKVIKCLEQNIRKQIDCKIIKYKRNKQEYRIFVLTYANRNINKQGVFADFATTKLVLNHIMQVLCH